MATPPADAELSRLQHWLLRQIVGDAAPHAHKDAVVASPNEIVRGSATLSARQRLAIYAHSYTLRLIECLREEFPALRLFVGDQVFDLFAGAYIADRPSQSYSLYGLGAGFADFLEATRPPGSGGQSLDAIPANLARLERAFAESQRAVGTEASPASAFPDETLLHLVPNLRWRLPDTTRLLRLDFDFSETLDAARRGDQPLVPPACEAGVAVARHRYRVRVHPLTPRRYAWLQAIGYDGAAMQEAVAAAASTLNADAGAVAADLLIWLPDAARSSLCCAAA